MEPKDKESSKRRFLFKRSQLSRAQRSLDSSSPAPSIQSCSGILQHHQQHHNNHNSNWDSHSVTGLPHHHNHHTTSGSTSSSPHYTPLSSRPASVARVGVMSAAGPSNSLDESVMMTSNGKRSSDGRIPPRRARSAERFDGMRIYNSGDEMLPRNFRSPQLAARNGVASGEVVPRNGPSPSSQQPTPTMPSPPPPYSSAITDITGPPSYRQAVAAMTAQAQQQQQQQQQQGKAAGARYNYAMAHRAAQSFDTGALPPMRPVGAASVLRSAASVPAFSEEDVICSCSKCEKLARAKDPYSADYNDAVYMESQAFLMHEIMTDGMAFCSIM